MIFLEFQCNGNSTLLNADRLEGIVENKKSGICTIIEKCFGDVGTEIIPDETYDQLMKQFIIFR